MGKVHDKIHKVNTYLDDNYRFIFQLMGLVAILFSMWAYIEGEKSSRASEERSYIWKRKELTQERLELKREKKNSYETSIKKYTKLIEEDSTDSEAQEKKIKFTRKLLNLYEGIARGVNVGIYDLSILDMTWGSAMLKVYKNNKEFVSEIRKKNKNAWSQLEIVIKLIEPMHKDILEDNDSEEEDSASKKADSSKEKE